MRRLVATATLAGMMFGLAGVPRTDGLAVTNEGLEVQIVNPTNGLPRGWSWAR